MSTVSPRTWITITLLAAIIAAAGSHIAKVLIVPGSIPPIGTIVAYSGPVEDIPRGWVPCDGLGTLPNGDKVPDLTGKFLMGTMEAGLAEGGDAGHAHEWVRRGSGNQEGVWYSYQSPEPGSSREAVDSWEHNEGSPGIHSTGSGTFPFIADPGATLFTSRQSNLPPYTAVRYIIRVR